MPINLPVDDCEVCDNESKFRPLYDDKLEAERKGVDPSAIPYICANCGAAHPSWEVNRS